MYKIIILFTVLVFLIGCGGSGSGDDSNSTAMDINSTEIENARILAEEEARIEEDARILAEEQAKIEEDARILAEEQKFRSQYYGKWLRVDTKEEIELLSSSNIENYDIQSDNLIKVYENDSSYYLMRAGLSDIVVNGTIENIENDATIKKSPSRIGGINVILANVLDKNINSTITTDDDGSFETSSLPSGTYNLTVDEEQISTITISKPIEEIGVYKLTGDNLHNFKAELILDDEFLYADERTHTAKIRIHNISNQVGYGLYYRLNLEDSDLKSFTNDLVKGSIEAKKYIDIPIYLNFNQISQNSKSVSVDVEIADVQNNKWADSFSFTLHKGYFSVNIATEENRVKGYIIMPNTHKVKNIDIDSYGTIRLPLVSNEEYHLLLSNSSFENETAYSLGINKAPQSFETFDETPAHEPNNREDTASNIVLKENILSYLHATDLDYWKISLPESEYLFDFTLKDFNIAQANLLEMTTSNSFTITDKITQGKDLAIEIDKGTLVINDIDTNSSTATVKTNDTVAIKLQAPSIHTDKTFSTLLIGQNSLIFTIFIDDGAPKFTSPSLITIDMDNNLSISTIKASDDNKIKYSIENQDFNLFKINEDSGELSFTTRPDNVADFEYELDIKATDSFNNSTIQKIVVKYNRFVRLETGVVKDNYTHNMWQDNIIKSSTHSVALEYCDNLNLSGYTDWELPTQDELLNILESESSGYISAVFVNKVSAGYWSSSSPSSSYYYPYCVDFSNGETSRYAELTNYSIRCTRTEK